MLSSITNESGSLIQKDAPVEGFVSNAVENPIYDLAVSPLQTKSKTTQKKHEDASKGGIAPFDDASGLSCESEIGRSFGLLSAAKSRSRTSLVESSIFEEGGAVGGETSRSSGFNDSSVFKYRRSMNKCLLPKGNRTEFQDNEMHYADLLFGEDGSKGDGQDKPKIAREETPYATVHFSDKDGSVVLGGADTNSSDKKQTVRKEGKDRPAMPVPLLTKPLPFGTSAISKVKSLTSELESKMATRGFGAQVTQPMRTGILKNNPDLKNDDAQNVKANTSDRLLKHESPKLEKAEETKDRGASLAARDSHNHGAPAIPPRHVGFKDSDDVDKSEEEDDDGDYEKIQENYMLPRREPISKPGSGCSSDSDSAKRKELGKAQKHKTRISEDKIIEGARDIVSRFDLKDSTANQIAEIISLGVGVFTNPEGFFQNKPESKSAPKRCERRDGEISDGHKMSEAKGEEFSKNEDVSKKARKAGEQSLSAAVSKQERKGKNSDHKKYGKDAGIRSLEGPEGSESTCDLQFVGKESKKSKHDAASISSNKSFKSSASNKSNKSIVERFFSIFSTTKKHKEESAEEEKARGSVKGADDSWSALDSHSMVEEYLLAAGYDRNDNSKRGKTAGSKYCGKTDPEHLFPLELMVKMVGSLAGKKEINKKRAAMCKDSKFLEAIHTISMVSPKNESGVVSEVINPCQLVRYGMNKHLAGMPNGFDVPIGTTEEKMQYDTCFFSAAMVVNFACKLGFERIFDGQAKTMAMMFRMNLENIFASRKEPDKIFVDRSTILKRNKDYCESLSTVFGASGSEGAFLTSFFDQYPQSEILLYNLFLEYCKKLRLGLEERYGSSASILKQFPQISFVENKINNFNTDGERVQPAVFENYADDKELRIGDVVFMDIKLGDREHPHPDDTCEVRRHVCDTKKNRYSLVCAVSRFSPSNTSGTSYVDGMKHEHYRVTVFKSDHLTVACDDDHCLRIHHKEGFGRSHPNLYGDLRKGFNTMIDMHPRDAIKLALMPLGTLVYQLDKLAK